LRRRLVNVRSRRYGPFIPQTPEDDASARARPRATVAPRPRSPVGSRLAVRALTFAYPVAKRDWAEERRFEEGLKRLRRWIV